MNHLDNQKLIKAIKAGKCVDLNDPFWRQILRTGNLTYTIGVSNYPKVECTVELFNFSGYDIRNSSFGVGTLFLVENIYGTVYRMSEKEDGSILVGFYYICSSEHLFKILLASYPTEDNL